MSQILTNEIENNLNNHWDNQKYLEQEENINNDNKNDNDIDDDNDIEKSRPFKCNFIDCFKEYSNRSRLQIHVRTHVYKLIYYNINISIYKISLN
jgi:hypothetical protein